MNYNKLSEEVWIHVDKTGSIASGYKSTFLARNENEQSFLHLFIDEKGKFHFAIEAFNISQKDIEDPALNGLNIHLAQYRLSEGGIKSFIDIRCNLAGFLKEFTKVIKEITISILENNELPITAVNHIVRKWKVFWAVENKQILSEEHQIGLICELIILEKLSVIHPANALSFWKGPFGEKHDFIFTDWCFEIKGTRSNRRIHTINGIDQLKPPDKKSLAFISFLVSVSDNEKAICLPQVIDEFLNVTYRSKPDLIVRFTEMLSKAGYNPIFSEEYYKFRLEILDFALYNVDYLFPSFTSENLLTPLSNRITAIKYDIYLDGLTGKYEREINWGNYFY